MKELHEGLVGVDDFIVVGFQGGKPWPQQSPEDIISSTSANSRVSSSALMSLTFYIYLLKTTQANLADDSNVFASANNLKTLEALYEL